MVKLELLVILPLVTTFEFKHNRVLEKVFGDGEVIQGTPAFNYGDFSKSYVHFRNLPKIVSDIEELKKKLD